MDLGPADAAAVTVTALFGVGILFGVVAERSAFCTMGAVADVVLFAGWRRARLWAAAIATAALVFQIGALTGGFAAGAGMSWRAETAWLAALGGMIFGAGMVAAGGCVSRAWIRAASGSAKGAAVVAAAAAGIAVTAPVAPLGDSRAEAVPEAVPVVGLAVALGLALWVLRDGRFRRLRGPLATGVAIGGLVGLAGFASPSAASDGIRFVVPLAMALERGPAAALGGLAIVAGVAAGAGASALAGGRFRGERWAGRGDVLGHLGGGFAMGVGGTLTLGCTVGAGITGVATMAPAAWLALAGMLAGAALALKLLLVGGPGGAWRALRRRVARGM